MATFSVPTPVKVRDGFANVFLPAGEYRAKFEDHRGYYYQAPEKIVGNNTGAWLWDGGLFIRKGAATPDRYYTIGRNNMVSLHRLGQAIEIQFSP